MNISSISSQSMSALMSQMKQKIDSTLAAAVNEANSENGNPLGTSVSFSGPAELLSKLSQLKDSDPEKFKSLMQDLAASLQEAADSAEEGTIEKNILSDMANKTKSVAESGNLGELMPSPPPQAQAGSNQANLAQYLLQGSNSSDSQSSLIDILLQNSSDSSDDDNSLLSVLLKQNESATGTSSDGNGVSMSSVRALLNQAFQKMIDNKSS